jgi:hypothetical protein
MRRLSNLLVFVVLALVLPRALFSQGKQGVLVGDVVAKETGTPLDHSMITVMSAGRQTFSSESGIFAFSNLASGSYRLRVTHLGFTPVEVTVDVPADAPPRRVRVELTRLSIQLKVVKVFAKPSCTNPGRPDPVANADFAAVIQQLRLNAEHYQLLADSFPFSYSVQRTARPMMGDSSRGVATIDTLDLRSDYRGWEYAMGNVVELTNTGFLMHLPELRDFAGIEFLNNHCFTYGGLDSTRDGPRLRIDFRADDQIRAPDVNGTIWLDAQSYQIRRADLEMSRMPNGLREVTAVRVTTLFEEMAPSIVVFHDVLGKTSLRHSGNGRRTVIASTEDQRLFRFTWIKDDPRHPSAQP